MNYRKKKKLQEKETRFIFVFYETTSVEHKVSRSSSFIFIYNYHNSYLKSHLLFFLTMPFTFNDEISSVIQITVNVNEN